jgi:hypothetical protein
MVTKTRRRAVSERSDEDAVGEERLLRNIIVVFKENGKWVRFLIGGARTAMEAR